MADDVTLPGTGEVIAADDVNGKKWQKVKAVWGADGTVNEADHAIGKQLPTRTVYTSVVYGTRTIADTFTKIPVTTLTGRHKVCIRNVGTATVYIGFDTSVTISNGYPLEPMEEWKETVTGDVYGIVATGTQEVRYQEYA